MVKKSSNDNFVEQAIAHVGGSPAVLAQRLSVISGEEVSRQRVHGWRLRGIFPREMMVHVEQLPGFKVRLDELVMAKPRERDAGNMVNRAIRFLGIDATPAMLAKELSDMSGRRITRQMVNGWQVLEQFPVDVVPYVHMLTKIPVKELVEGKARAHRKKYRKAEAARP